MNEQDAAAQYWDERHFDPTFLRGEWSFHPLAKARLHQVLGGASSRERWFHDRHLRGRSGLRGLGVGVGRGASELALLAMGGFTRYDLYDISAKSLADAAREAERLGVADQARFHVTDIGQVDLGEGTYDVITFIASLHHMMDLDAVLRQCHRALAPGGVLWAAEYTGPDHFDYPPEHADFPRRLYRMLHPAIRRAGEPELKFPTREDVIANDPTESPHSSRIVDNFQRIWPDGEIIGTYGTLAFMIMWTLDHDVLYDTTHGWQAFQTILDMDTALIDAGKLPHYFAYLIGRKPGKALSREARTSLPLSLINRFASRRRWWHLAKASRDCPNIGGIMPL